MQKSDQEAEELANNKRSAVDQAATLKRLKTDETQILEKVSSVAGIKKDSSVDRARDSSVVSKPPPCGAAAVLRRLEDAALRKELQLRIEDDPYGNHICMFSGIGHV